MNGSEKIGKVREDRIRRVADRQGLVLRKSPRRDARALDCDRFRLSDSNWVVVSAAARMARDSPPAWTISRNT